MLLSASVSPAVPISAHSEASPRMLRTALVTAAAEPSHSRLTSCTGRAAVRLNWFTASRMPVA
jgi:hypothetical protein